MKLQSKSGEEPELKTGEKVVPHFASRFGGIEATGHI